MTTLILSPDSDYHLAEQRPLDAVEGVYAKYRDEIEEQHQRMEQTSGTPNIQPVSEAHNAA